MLKITVADDETPIRKWICSIIRRLPDLYTLAGVASNGKEALEYIRTEHPDIALLDIKMPVMDGLQVLMHCFRKKPVRFPSCSQIMTISVRSRLFHEGALIIC